MSADLVVIGCVLGVLVVVAVESVREEREFRRLCAKWDREIGETLRGESKPKLRVVQGGASRAPRR